jgi:hypothetical protein
MRRPSRAGGAPVKARRRKPVALKRRSAVIAGPERRDLQEQLDLRTQELRGALEQQAATAEVLRVISSSPGELGPVFQAMLENAVRVCDAKFGILFRYDNKTFNPVAHFGVTPEHAEFMRQRGSFQPTAGSGLDRVLRTKELVPLHSDYDSLVWASRRVAGCG